MNCSAGDSDTWASTGITRMMLGSIARRLRRGGAGKEEFHFSAHLRDRDGKRALLNWRVRSGSQRTDWQTLGSTLAGFFSAEVRALTDRSFDTRGLGVIAGTSKNLLAISALRCGSWGAYQQGVCQNNI